MRRGGQEIILSLVTSCPDAEVPGGAALAVHAEAAQRERERERERARVNITTYYSHYESSQRSTAAPAHSTLQIAPVKASQG